MQLWGLCAPCEIAVGVFSSPLADLSISKLCGAAICREGGHGATSSWALDSSGRADRRRQQAEDGPFFHDEHFNSSCKKDDKKKRARAFRGGCIKIWLWNQWG